MKILKTTDKVKLTIPDSTISVVISPLSAKQKLEISSKMKMVKGEEIPDYNAQGMLLIKYSLKEVYGISDYEGNDYKLEFELNGDGLTENCVDDVSSILSESNLILPVTLAANKVLSKIENVKVEVNPKS